MSDKSFLDRVNDLSSEFDQDIVQEVVSFVKSESSRSFCQPKNKFISDSDA